MIYSKIPAANPRQFNHSFAERLSLSDLLQYVREFVPPRLNLIKSPKAITPAAQPVEASQSLILTPPQVKLNSKPKQSVTTGHDFGEAVEVQYQTKTWDSQSRTLGEGIFEEYEPQRLVIPNGKPHPTPLVESAAMASVSPPLPTYHPLLPKRALDEGWLSTAQLEALIYAGQAHEQMLEGYYRIDKTGDNLERVGRDTEGAFQLRRSYLVGDSTGVGKGRIGSSIILDNWMQGRKKALWVSASSTLLEDARRDWVSLGGLQEQIVPLSKLKPGQPIQRSEGIVFVTYATLRQPERQGQKSRLEQLVEWFGKDYDGAILFDESHLMANAVSQKGERGIKEASQQGLVGLRLQRLLPNSRLTYLSATGATELENLAYAERLGLWLGDDFSFKSRQDFMIDVGAGGVAALECVARDLKSFGLYISRSISYSGIEYVRFVCTK